MRVKQIFNITFPGEVDFVYLHNRKWITADKYPYFTLLGQSLGSVYLGMEALSAYQPGHFLFFILKLTFFAALTLIRTILLQIYS